MNLAAVVPKNVGGLGLGLQKWQYQSHADTDPSSQLALHLLAIRNARQPLALVHLAIAVRVQRLGKPSALDALAKEALDFFVVAQHPLQLGHVQQSIVVLVVMLECLRRIAAVVQVAHMAGGARRALQCRPVARVARWGLVWLGALQKGLPCQLHHFPVRPHRLADRRSAADRLRPAQPAQPPHGMSVIAAVMQDRDGKKGGDPAAHQQASTHSRAHAARMLGGRGGGPARLTSHAVARRPARPCQRGRQQTPPGRPHAVVHRSLGRIGVLIRICPRAPHARSHDASLLLLGTYAKPDNPEGKRGQSSS
jgi:hypothetical protein